MFGDKSKRGRNGANALETLIGPRVVIRGDVSFSGGLYVEGKILGKVQAEDGADAVITIAEHGLIEGEVRAPVVVVSGQLNGEVFAAQRVELLANARVQGNIHYKVVEMAAGAMISGRLIHVEAPMPQLTGPESALA
jgi:cytoskeletal protein CcmA (bactofilin family)